MNMDGLQEFFRSLEGGAGYVFLFFSSLGENLFPPMPGDTFVVLGAFLVGRGHLDFVPAYLSASAGSLLGFMMLYFVGLRWGRKIFQGRTGRFFSQDRLVEVEFWFDRYGYVVIAVNRLLSGFRALVSLGAGIARMDAKRVFGLCLVSVLIWNGILMGVGVYVGENWAVIVRHYQWIVFVLIAGIILVSLIRARMRKREAR